MALEEIRLALRQAIKASDHDYSSLADYQGRQYQGTVNRFGESTPTNPDILDLYSTIELTGDTTPLEIICEHHGGKFTSNTKKTAESLVMALIHASTEHGEIMRVFEECSEDGEIDDNEKLRMRRQINEAIDSLKIALNTLAVE